MTYGKGTLEDSRCVECRILLIFIKVNAAITSGINLKNKLNYINYMTWN